MIFLFLLVTDFVVLSQSLRVGAYTDASGVFVRKDMPVSAQTHNYTGGPVPTRDNIFVLWCGKRPDTHVSHQLQHLLKGISFFQPQSPVYFITERKILSASLEKKLTAFPNVHPVFWSSSFLDGTPVEGIQPEEPNWVEFSDVVRVVVLWRWGGTYIDADDLMVGPLIRDLNVLPILEWPGMETISWKNATLPLVDGRHKHNPSLNPEWNFQAQADPMVNFEPGNPFLWAWMQKMAENRSSRDWGQIIPTEIIRARPKEFARHIHLVPQHYLLIHPAFARFF
mmetsp:Transcript_50524/g.126592  ORF Transcript_50524/g.126592 Transcript_50524/m.126592 type:complete len:282 (+) Transcript_50524:115-960(+)